MAATADSRALSKEALLARLDTVKSPHFLEDCPSWVLPTGQKQVLTLQGHSVAGERTGFVVPELRLFLDGGMNSNKNCCAILVTHSHSDHSHNLPCVAMGQGGDTCKRPHVYIPEASAEPLQILARASQALNDSREVHERQEMNVVGVAAGSSFSMLGGRCKGAELQVDVLECFHAVPSVGYRVCAVSNPLRAELRGASGAELRSRKEAGEEITMRVATPLFTFLGDTTERVFDDPLVLASPVVIVECTGVEPRQPPEEIRRWGHIHWQQLEPVVRAHPAVVFVLIHFSNSLKEASIFHTVLASALKNVVLWFDSGVVEMAKYI